MGSIDYQAANLNEEDTKLKLICTYCACRARIDAEIDAKLSEICNILGIEA